MSQFNSKPLCSIIAASAAAIAITADSAAAQANGNNDNQSEMIARADADGDGDITWDEVTALRVKTFDRLDRNNDGVVNANDRPPRRFAARFNDALEKLQKDFDSDRDGEITEEEMLNAPAPMFAQGDANDDGVLTSEEMAALRAESTPL